jgi:hypothetical protein
LVLTIVQEFDGCRCYERQIAATEETGFINFEKRIVCSEDFPYQNEDNLKVDASQSRSQACLSGANTRHPTLSTRPAEPLDTTNLAMKDKYSPAKIAEILGRIEKAVDRIMGHLESERGARNGLCGRSGCPETGSLTCSRSTKALVDTSV